MHSVVVVILLVDLKKVRAVRETFKSCTLLKIIKGKKCWLAWPGQGTVERLSFFSVIYLFRFYFSQAASQSVSRQGGYADRPS